MIDCRSLLFLFLIPCHLLWTASRSRVANSDMPAIAILKVSLWGYYLLVLVSSPIVKLFQVVLVPSHKNKTHSDLLDKCLFPPKNDVMKRLLAIQEKARKHNRFADGSARTRVDIGGNMKAASFYQTVKCK
uniref:Uncharacterized protein n=1 Tax=Timema tahoe TaxID=61484 RepID=A0A7R9IB43_9NEOP|nr:unnamed protein product [Timema tahoe]